MTPTNAFNPNFSRLNYDSLDAFRNLGSVNVVIAVLLLKLLTWLVLGSKYFKRVIVLRKFNLSKRLHDSGQEWLRFMLELFFEFLIVTWAALVPSSQPNLLDFDVWIPGDYFSFHYTWVLIVSYSVFLCFTCYVVFSRLLNMAQHNFSELERRYAAQLISVVELAASHSYDTRITQSYKQAQNQHSRVGSHFKSLY